MSEDIPLRPFLPPDAIALRELFAQSIEELTAEDYDDDQRAAWASVAEDGAAFAARLGEMLTLVVEQDGECLGFGSLKDDRIIDMLFVHPHYAGAGIGTALAEALERIAASRGAEAVTVEASDTAALFFEGRGYVPVQRNCRRVDDQWLTNTTMKKELTPADEKAAP